MYAQKTPVTDPCFFLNSGASRIWYSVPSSQADRFHEVVSKLAPHVHQSDVGIPSDACLIPPQLLLDRGVQLERIEQKPGEIMVILDGCYSSNISCGYSISESVYFTWNDWLAESWQRYDFRGLVSLESRVPSGRIGHPRTRGCYFEFWKICASTDSTS